MGVVGGRTDWDRWERELMFARRRDPGALALRLLAVRRSGHPQIRARRDAWAREVHALVERHAVLAEASLDGSRLPDVFAVLLVDAGWRAVPGVTATDLLLASGVVGRMGREEASAWVERVVAGAGGAAEASTA